MMLRRERASLEEGRVEGWRVDDGESEEGTEREKEGREEASGGGIERGREGAWEQGREGNFKGYSQTNHSHTGPCP